MKKLVLVALVVVLIGGSASLASANLIVNSSFENLSSPPPDYFQNWNEYGGASAATTQVHSGTYSAHLQINPTAPYNSGVVSDKFTITEAGTYQFGAWFKLLSLVDPTAVYNNNRTGVTTNIYFTSASGLPNAYPNIIYDISGAPGTTWTDILGSYYSNWMFIGGTFNIANAADVLNGELNIFLQTYNSIYSAVFVDDAIVERVSPVPESATVLLLASGLLGLAGVRRKFEK